MNKFSTWLWRTAFWLRYKVGYGLKVYGRDNFPMEGPVIVVPNHLSNNDPPICGYALPRHVHFMAKQELFVNPISRFFCTWLGAFPLNRGAIDKIAIRHALGLLKNNKVLGIFAEGNRQKNGKLGRFHDGAASIALRTGIGITPVAIIGSHNMKRNQVACIIGKQVPVSKAKPTPEAIKEVNDRVKGEIQRMIDSYHENRIEETLWKYDFHELHSHFASITHGCLFRNALAWEEYWRWDEDDTNVAVYYNTKDKPCGFMVYLIKNDIMHIKEMIYLNREAKKGLWEYIHAHDSMIDAVHGYTYFSEPIAFEMDDGDIKETIRPYAMGRIIDIESFLQDYPCDPDGGTLYIELEIEDHLLLWNNRSFRLCFSDGTCMLTDEPAEYKLKMEIGTLTTLLLGYKTAERLYALERIEGKQEAVDRLDDVLFHKIPYISDYI